MFRVRNLLALLAMLSTFSVAQANTEDPSPILNLLTSSLKELCPKELANLVTRHDMLLAIRKRPIDIQSVCQCSITAVLADKKLVEHFRTDQETFRKRTEFGNLKPYTALRYVKSQFDCLAAEIELSLEQIELEK